MRRAHFEFAFCNDDHPGARLCAFVEFVPGLERALGLIRQDIGCNLGSDVGPDCPLPVQKCLYRFSVDECNEGENHRRERQCYCCLQALAHTYAGMLSLGCLLLPPLTLPEILFGGRERVCEILIMAQSSAAFSRSPRRTRSRSCVPPPRHSFASLRTSSLRL